LQEQHKIILIDSTIPKSFYSNLNEFDKIISLDFVSHENLKCDNINHIQSDALVPGNEYCDLERLSYTFLYWYESEIFKDKMTYDKIVLPELIYADLYIMILPILKTFFDISMITKHSENSVFFVSSKISDYVKQFNVKFQEISSPITREELYLDNIYHEINFNKIRFKIPISNNTFKRIKNLISKICNIFLNSAVFDLKNSHLFVELDPKKYNKLFSNFDDSSNFLIYNRRRPYFWDLNSFAILKKSKCHVITEDQLIDKNPKRITKSHKWRFDAFSVLNNNQKLFNRFFSLNGKSFWPILCNSFFNLYESRFKELIIEIELANKIFEKFNISTVTILSELGTTELILLTVAKRKKIPVILLQHGLWHDAKSALEYNFFTGIIPKKSDYFFIWGKMAYEYCKSNCLSSKPVISGNPYFDNIKQCSDVSSSTSSYVLLATQGPSNFSLFGFQNSLIEKYVETIKQICVIVKNLNKKLIIKLHPDPYEFDISKYVSNIDKNITIIKNGNINQLIKNCEIFLTIDLSTTIIEAQLYNKPVISISVKEYLDLSNSTIFKSCLRIDIEDLEKNLIEILNNPNAKNELIDKGIKFVNQYVSHETNSSKNLINLLNNL